MVIVAVTTRTSIPRHATHNCHQPAGDRPEPAPDFDPYQQIGAGVGNRGEQRLRGEVAVGQHDHPPAHRLEQVMGVAALADPVAAERGIHDRAGAAGHQRQ
jgi:hypothetical protein